MPPPFPIISSEQGELASAASQLPLHNTIISFTRFATKERRAIMHSRNLQPIFLDDEGLSSSSESAESDSTPGSESGSESE